MKRLFCLALALCLAVVLTACGQAPSNASPDNALTELFRQEGVTWAGCTGETAAAFDLEDGQLTIVAVTCDVQADGSESYGRRQQRTGAAWDDQVLCTLYRDSELPGLIFAWQVAEETSGETCLDLTLRYAPGNGTFPLKEGQTLRLYPMQFPDADKTAESKSDGLRSGTADQQAFIRLAELYLQRRRTVDPAADDLNGLLKLFRGSGIVETLMGNGLAPTPENRAALAAAVGIPDYTGSDAQDEQLLAALGAPEEITPLP